MERLLEAVLLPLGEEFEVQDVDSRSEWRERFGEVIPVLLRDGKPVAKIRLDRSHLERIVQKSRNGRG